ncbi:DMT family transporter [Arcanobacterium haemolyticum]|nr:DMT family transporter [Arcanobacterium haemolyticum]
MKWGIFSGALWGLDTVVLGMIFAIAPFIDSPHASLASAIMHDTACALVLLIYMGIRGRLRDTLAALRTRPGRAVMGAAILGGPVGMTGYLIAINNIGPGYTAIISTFYPAVGTLLAFVFLKERMHMRQVLALLVALGAIIAIGWSSTGETTGGSPIIGIIAALACVVGWGSEAVILAWGMREEAVDNETALHIRQTTSAFVYLVVVAPIAGALPFVVQAAPTRGTLVLTVAAIAGTASYLFYYRAIGTIGASRGMALNISYSAWAVFFSLILLGSRPGLFQVGCCLVILCGTVLAATPNWRELLPGSFRNTDDESLIANRAE